MPVQMVRIRHVGMPVSERRMVMPVAVLTRWHRVVWMDVVGVVVAMGVFVVQRLVVVVVLV
jgi:hypothetical protein